MTPVTLDYRKEIQNMFTEEVEHQHQRKQSYEQASDMAADMLMRAIIQRLVNHIEGYTRNDLENYFKGMVTALGLAEDVLVLLIDEMIEKDILIRLSHEGDPSDPSEWSGNFAWPTDKDVIRVSPQTWIEAVA